MENNVFRYTKSMRFTALFLLLPLFFMFGSMIIGILEPTTWADRIVVGDYPSAWGIALSIFAICAILLELWFFVQMATFPLTYSVTFSDTALQLKARDFWGRKYFNSLHRSYFIGEIPGSPQYSSAMRLSLPLTPAGLVPHAGRCRHSA